MQIVVIDGYTLNPGDLSWSALEQLGKVTIYDRTTEEEVIPRCREAEIVLTNKVKISRSVISRLPKLKYIGVLATGVNIVDQEAAAEHNITVTNVPSYGTLSVAQMTFAHILHLTNHVSEHAASVSKKDWTASPDFSYWLFPLVELQDLTLGIVGLGRIGRAVAEIGLRFGMRVIFYDIHLPNDLPENIQPVALETLFRQSDILSLHCPLRPETERIVTAQRLALMKSTAFLINTSRGPLIDEKALAEALNSDRIAGAGLDVLSVEPPTEDNPLPEAKNCYITPHIAWATKAARQRLLHTVVENLRAFLAGKPQNVVNGD